MRNSIFTFFLNTRHLLTSIAMVLPLPILAATVTLAQTQEGNTNRPGGDYRKFEITPRVGSIAGDGVVEGCRDACQKESQCVAWTAVRPGVQSKNGVCWLKKTIPDKRADNCCTSGTSGRSGPAASTGTPTTTFTPEGGSGDHSRTVRCQKGSFIVGFVGRSGSWIDSIGIVCGTPDASRRMLRTGGGQTGLNGGSGGAPAEAACDLFGVIATIRPRLTTGNRQVQGIDIECRSTRTDSLRPMVFGAAGGTGVTKERCPIGEAAEAVQIRYGQHLNAIALVCARFAIPKS